MLQPTRTAAVDAAAAPSLAVVSAVAAREGVAPTALEPRLGEVVDPDALDALTGDGAHPDVVVRFDYLGYQVEVHGDGTVAVEH